MTPRNPPVSSEVAITRRERTQRYTADRERTASWWVGGLGRTTLRSIRHIRAGRLPRPATGRRRVDEPGSRRIVQGVIKSYDPGTGDGVVVRESDFAEFDLADGALDGSIFRMLRQGQRVLFDLDGQGRATHLSLGSEVDMGTPDLG